MAATRPKPALYILGEGRSTPRILPPWSRDPAAAPPNCIPLTPWPAPTLLRCARGVIVALQVILKVP